MAITTSSGEKGGAAAGALGAESKFGMGGTAPRGAASSRFSGLSPRILIFRVLLGLCFLLVWQLTWPLVDSLIGRSPLQVWNALVDLASTGVLWPSFLSTISATFVAFLLGGVVGVTLGIGLGLVPRVEAVVDPYIDALNSLPRVALAPVFIVYFGINQNAKVALAFSLVVFVMLVAARSGIRSADPDVVKLCKAMDVSRVQMFFKVLLPTAYPSIFGGLRLSLIYSVLGVVTSEIIASRAGLGQLIAQYSGLFRMEYVYAVIFVLLFFSTFVNLVMAALEKRLLRWKTKVT